VELVWSKAVFRSSYGFGDIYSVQLSVTPADERTCVTDTCLSKAVFRSSCGAGCRRCVVEALSDMVTCAHPWELQKVVLNKYRQTLHIR